MIAAIKKRFACEVRLHSTARLTVSLQETFVDHAVLHTAYRPVESVVSKFALYFFAQARWAPFSVLLQEKLAHGIQNVRCEQEGERSRANAVELTEPLNDSCRQSSIPVHPSSFSEAVRASSYLKCVRGEMRKKVTASDAMRARKPNDVTRQRFDIACAEASWRERQEADRNIAPPICILVANGDRGHDK